MGIIDFSFRAKPYAGIARRGGRSPSAARKLPKQKPRSPRGMSEAGKPQGGASGGMQGGPRRGRSPITGPALPPAAQAAQTKIKKSPRARRAQKPSLKGQALIYFLQSARRAYPCPVAHTPAAHTPTKSKKASTSPLGRQIAAWSNDRWPRPEHPRYQDPSRRF